MYSGPGTSPHARVRRRRVALAALAAWLVIPALGASNAASQTPQTIVSLTFDDGTATQFQADQMLADHGMNGTFYVNSSRIGANDYYMTWAEVEQLATHGNEIGGHTAHHANLPLTDSTEAQRQICLDRVNLLNQGFDVKNFAYPHGANDASVREMVESCGYNSARTTSSVVSENIPPPEPYAIRVATGSGDLDVLKNAVTQAEQSGGGWVPIVFHQLCNACDSNWIRTADFEAFLDWLQPRAANGTAVQTVDEVIGGPVQPAVQPPPPPPAPNGFNALKNSSLETDSNGDLTPDCWQFDGFGDHDFDWTRTPDAHSGSWAERVEITNYQTGDAKLVPSYDLGFCTPTVLSGHRYRLSAWYKSTAPVLFASFSRDSLGGFSFFESSPEFPAAPTWTHVTWDTPVIPDGMTGLTFGLGIDTNGTLTVDDLGIDDASPTGAPDTTPPMVSLTAPAANSTVSGTVPLTATATDNVGIDRVDYLVDGTVVGSTSSSPYTFNWNARSVPNGTHTVAARAVDTSSNTTTTATIRVLVANSTTNLLQNPSLEAGSGSTPACWQLGGFGMNTFAWTRTSDAHTGNFAQKLDVTSLSTGDRKMVVAQDAGTCAVSAIVGHSYTVSGWYKSPSDPNPTGSQPFIYAFYRNVSGSWVYWSQSPRLPASSTWRQATWTTPALPAGATHVSIGMGLNTHGTLTMDDFSLSDDAPLPDTTAPTSEITCNDESSHGDEASGLDEGCIDGYYREPVEVRLTATDNEFGSGVASIRYTTDNSEPTLANGTTYGGAFSVPPPGATVKWRAYDKAGNAEPVRGEVIRIDTNAPTSSIECNGGSCRSDHYNGAVSVTLGATDTGGSELREIRYTTDGSQPTANSGSSYLGAFSVSGTRTVKYRAFDNAGNAESVQTKAIQIDTDPPTTAIECDGAACTDQTYASAVSVGLDATDNAGGSGVREVRYTTDGSDPTPSHGEVYAGPFSLSSTAAVKYRAFDNAGNAGAVGSRLIRVDTSAPASITLTSPADGSTVSDTLDLRADTSDEAVESVEFLVDGEPVATDSTSPYVEEWDSTSVSDGAHEITARALDENDTEIGLDSISVTVDNSGSAPDTTPPASTIACNGAACSSGTYNSAVTVELQATDDPGGSGVDEIRYTTDGSRPTASHGTVYSASFSLTTNTTVKYRAFDHAGNAEPVNTQLMRIDRIAPTSSISCGGAACASNYSNTPVSVSLAATDEGGSGVDEIRFTTDGSEPTRSNGTVYASAFTLGSTTTVKYRAFDEAGNAEPVNSALIRVDTTPPSTAIACNGGDCSGHFQPGVSVSFDANDAGSGVASIRYTTDGSDPTASNGTVYGAPFTLSATRTVKYRAFDNAVNAEPVATRQVQVDGTAPSASVTNLNPGDLLEGTATLTASAVDDVGVARVDFLVDGQQVGASSSAPYSFAWGTQVVTDGVHSISVRAVDTAGNTKTSSAVSVMIANNNLLRNPSLETSAGSGASCWTRGGYGTNVFTWTRTSDAHTGSFGELLTITSLTTGDRKLVSAQDAGACAPSGTPGRTYTVTAWYKSVDRPTIFAYYRNSAGTWAYWSQSPRLDPSASWVRRAWTTPALPSGATAVSVGLGLLGPGSVTMDDLGLFLNG